MSVREQVGTVELPAESLRVPRTEVFRYMGLRGQKPDGALAALTESCLSAFGRVVRYRACYLVLPVRRTGGGVDFGAFFAAGQSLSRHLEGCDRAVVFAATTGMAAELQRRRAAVVSPARALVLEAVGTAAVEGFCDELCRRWEKEFAGCPLRTRFSPGYGDLPLAVQKPLLGCLDSGRKAGITLTDSLLMVPQKSVSAIVGIGPEGGAPLRGCEGCGRQDCAFRRQEDL